MKKKILLLFALIASLTGAYAEGEGALSIANVKNVVPGYTGSFDIVLSGSTKTYAGYQFTLTLPTGLTYDHYSNGELIDGHTATITGDAAKTFTGAANPSANFTAMNGTLLTIYFTVSGNATGTLNGCSLSTVRMSDINSNSSVLADVNFSIEVGNTITLDENETSAPSAISDVNVIVNRTLKAGVWNTICLPFAMSAEQISSAFGSADIANLSSVTNVKEYNTDEDEDVIVQLKFGFTSVTAMDAHHPYLIKVPSDMTYFQVNSVSITSGAPEHNAGTTNNYKKFVGTYTPTSVPSGCLYLSNNLFKYSGGHATLKGFRGYFYLRDNLYGWNTSSSRSIILDIDGSTTAVENVKVKKTDVRSDVFNLHGQRVVNPTKGVYVVEGKKVMIK